MKEKLAVRLFYESACGCGGCGCGPNRDMEAFVAFAEKLAQKFGRDNLNFEAYNGVDSKKFPFLQKKTKTPAVLVGEKVLSSGKLPIFQDLEAEVAEQLQKK
jgi:hypothetical protein